jgi:hypothetical protein
LWWAFAAGWTGHFPDNSLYIPVGPNGGIDHLGGKKTQLENRPMDGSQKPTFSQTISSGKKHKQDVWEPFRCLLRFYQEYQYFSFCEGFAEFASSKAINL